MNYRKIFTLLIVTTISLIASQVQGENKLKVVTTLSTYADIASSIGGDRIDVSYVASPRFNPHFIEPRPSDVLKLKRCDLFIHSGLDLEVWRDALVNAAGVSELRTNGSRQLDLSIGIPLLEVPTTTLTRAAGDIHIFGNPHFWMSPENGLRIAKSILDKLMSLDPSNAEIYKANYDKFSADLNKKIIEWRSLAAPYSGTELIGYHNEWVYLMDFLGFKINHFLEPKPGVPPTPQHMEFLVKYIMEKNIRAILQASFFPQDSGRHVTEKSGIKLVLLSQNVGETEEDVNYQVMLDRNISKILGALKHE